MIPSHPSHVLGLLTATKHTSLHSPPQSLYLALTVSATPSPSIRCLESGFMDLDQQADQAQQKQSQGAASVPLTAHSSMQGQGQDAYSPRGFQSNPVTASGSNYSNTASSGPSPGGRGGLVTYPLPASVSASAGTSNLKSSSSSFTPSGAGRTHASRVYTQGQGTGQGQSQSAATDFPYGTQTAQFPSYSPSMQTQSQYAGQQSNTYAQQGQYTSQQQQPYY